MISHASRLDRVYGPHSLSRVLIYLCPDFPIRDSALSRDETLEKASLVPRLRVFLLSKFNAAVALRSLSLIRIKKRSQTCPLHIVTITPSAGSLSAWERRQEENCRMHGSGFHEISGQG